jgi:RsiW-degrading membrane proteinase PrsW (M82 family)
VRDGHAYRVPGRSPAIADPYRTRKIVGLTLWSVGQAGGLLLLVVLFGLPPLLEANPFRTFFSMAVGGMLAFPAMAIYLTFLRLLDRYDPEPLDALVLCLLWGACAATGYSALVNSVIAEFTTALAGPSVGGFVGAVISAPVVEEFWKGLAVWGVFYYLRREFDGVIDGIIYATFTAIGFAATENVIYYGRALAQDPQALVATFVMRGLIAPWGHPLYTSMTGIGLGLARESHRHSVKLLAPAIGYFGAVFLHALWNGSATVADAMGAPGLFLLMLPLWFLFVISFVIMVVILVQRRGRIIREHLVDEVALGHLTECELDLVCSMFGGVVAWLRRGRRGTEFVRSVARLGLSKWHAARAMKSQTHTYSMEFIVPLRARIRELREQGSSPV